MTDDDGGHKSYLAGRPLKLVAVHLGAGNSRNDLKYSEFAKMICEEVMLQKWKPKCDINLSKDNSDSCPECLARQSNNNRLTAESAVVQLIQRMEDNQDLNCAFGSNLNMLGQVECDASLMSDKTQIWCGVGAVPGCKNPIALVKSLYDHQTVARPLGLVQPNLLVGSGAKQWMREHCPHLTVVESRLISSRSFAQYQRFKSRYDGVIRAARGEGFQHLNNPSRAVSRSVSLQNVKKVFGDCLQPEIESSSSTASLDHGSYCLPVVHTASIGSMDTTSDEDLVIKFEGLEETSLDTVGAIAVDCDNNFVSAISSGGLMLKFKGRVGQAAVPGAGCWAKDNVAATTTGVGEYLTASSFAKNFYDKLQTIRLLYDLGHVDTQIDMSHVINSCIEECFEDLSRSSALSHVPESERLAGILAVSSLNSKDSPPWYGTDKRDLYLSYGHNSNTMCIGYITSHDVAGSSVMSRKDPDSRNSGKPCVRTIKFTID